MLRVSSHFRRQLSALFTATVLASSALPMLPSQIALAQSNPTTVTIAGSLQSEAGCSGDWDPACAATHLALDGGDDVWQGSFNLAAGNYEYKAAINNDWPENYGLHAQPGGANIPLNLAAGTSVKFYYDHKSHWVTDNQSSVIAVAAGSFQSELGCPGDWQPDCMRSWLQDPDGDGTYVLETTAIRAGNYEAKVAINESWDENYGQGGVAGGANIAFVVPANGAKVVFKYVAATHVLTILTGHGLDGNVEYNGLRHDSRDTLYRTPSGAVPMGSEVRLRLRTFHNDVDKVTLRKYDLNASAQSLVPMKIIAADVPCFQSDLATETCDFWEATVTSTVANNFWYRFIINDGATVAYYGDNTSALDGGLGAATPNPIDQSYALMFYQPNFSVPSWVRNQVIYQIFPDRFSNGDKNNDPKTGDLRYDDPVMKLPWGTLPEGYCRNYADGATNCPSRFPSNPAVKEQPRGRDYYGGDLDGVIDKLDYLRLLGVTTIYFNPIFAAKSNHRYDTADYKNIDPALGNNKTFQKLVKEAGKRGMRVILDGVFNHMSSDSPNFDRYHHYAGNNGACESATSAWRGWFVFRAPGGTEPAPCAPSPVGGIDTYYDGWFGFDSIPVLKKDNSAVQSYFLTGPDNVAQFWLKQGAAGWRLDVMGDASFPNGYWETFRSQVRQADPNAVIIGELWQKDSTLLRFLRGDRADSTMNYRLRDAVLGLLAPGAFDSKGFGDSGRIIAPSEFAARLNSIQEDYPKDVFYALMNLLDSHDTERLLWTLTPGQATLTDKAANEAAGKQRLRLASLIQFTLPGAPTVYYGDEAGVTGADDPDDRRTYPWPNTGGKPDTNLVLHYAALSVLRNLVPALTQGDLKILLADDASGAVVYGRKTNNQAALVAINRSAITQTLSVPVAGYLPDGLKMGRRWPIDGLYSQDNSSKVVNGAVSVIVAPMSGVVLANLANDLVGPAASTLQRTSEGNGSVGLSWSAVSDAKRYNLYRSPISGGGWSKVNASPITGTSYTDTGLPNARNVYYVVKGVDAAGNEGVASNEVNALPHLSIGWANVQWPPDINHVISAINRTPDVYGQVWIDGVTNAPGATQGLLAQLGYGPSGSDPNGNAAWVWVDASFNTDAGNNDEFKASLLPEQVGSYAYAYRYSTTNGRDWVYADLDGIGNGYSAAQAGKLTVVASGDTAAPSAPGNVRVLSASPAGIDVAWDAATDNDAVYGYDVLRATGAGGPYTRIARVVGDTHYNDTSVVEGNRYYYVVQAVDKSFNRSGNSTEVNALAAVRTVTLVFNVSVPASTPSDKSVYIAGFLDRLDGGLPQWNPGGVVLTKVSATQWTITLTGKEGTQIEYKYALGSWDFVEKDGSCGETANRTLTLSYGSNGQQTVADSVPNWRNVAPCGN